MFKPNSWKRYLRAARRKQRQARRVDRVHGVEALEPRMLLSASLLVDPGVDQSAVEGDALNIAGVFEDTAPPPVAGFTVTQVTNSPSLFDDRLDVDGDRMVFRAELEKPLTGGGTEVVEDILLYDASDDSLTNLTNIAAGSLRNVSVAELEGDRVIWLENGKVMALDLSVAGAAATQISSTTEVATTISLGGDVAAWLVQAGGGNQQLRAYDLSTGTAVAGLPTSGQVGNSGTQGEPTTDGEHIAWTSFGTDGSFDVFLFDIAAQTTTNISSGVESGVSFGLASVNPVLDSGNVIWTAAVSGLNNLFLWDGQAGAGTYLTGDSLFDIEPSLSGRRAVWTTELSPSNRDVVLYDLDTQTKTTLAGGPGSQVSADIDGARVAWVDRSVNEVFTINLDELAADPLLEPTQISSTATRDLGPLVSGDNIGWRVLATSSPSSPTDVFFAKGASAVTYDITWDLGDGTIVEDVLDLTHEYADNGVYTVSLTVEASDGRSTTESFTATIDNADPVITSFAADASVVDEGQTVTVTGSFTDAGAADTHTVDVDFGGTVVSAVVDQSAGTFAASYTFDDDFVGDITATVTDDDTGIATAATPITVNNVAPTVDPLSGPATAVRGQDVTFAGTFTDPGADTFTQSWTVTDAGGAVIATGTGPEVTFSSDTLGTLTVTYTVTDDDSGVGSASATVDIAAVGLVSDPANPGQTTLLVGGAAGNDFTVIRTNSSGQLTVFTDGANQGAFTADRVVVYGNDGDDFIFVAGSVTDVDVELYGGAGNDWLRGGRGDDFISGGAGDDFIVGSAGRDFLVGGLGSDLVLGQRHDDILVGGVWDGEDDRANISAIMDEWTRTDLNYYDRVANLENGGGLNGSVTINSSNVFDDNSFDILLGLQGRDWFHADDEDFTDERRNELLSETEIDFADSEDVTTV